MPAKDSVDPDVAAVMDVAVLASSAPLPQPAAGQPSVASQLPATAPALAPSPAATSPLPPASPARPASQLPAMAPAPSPAPTSPLPPVSQAKPPSQPAASKQKERPNRAKYRECDENCEIPVGWADRLYHSLLNLCTATYATYLNRDRLIAAFVELEYCEACEQRQVPGLGSWLLLYRHGRRSCIEETSISVSVTGDACNPPQQCQDGLRWLRHLVAPHFVKVRTTLRTLYKIRETLFFIIEVPLSNYLCRDIVLRWSWKRRWTMETKRSYAPCLRARKGSTGAKNAGKECSARRLGCQHSPRRSSVLCFVHCWTSSMKASETSGTGTRREREGR